MKNTLPLLLLVLCALACNNFGPDTSSQSNATDANNSAKAPSKPVKQLDVPSLLGKSKEEVKKIVASEPKSEMPEELEWRIPDKYELDVNFGKGKATDVTYALPVGWQVGVNTPEDMAALAGIDLGGKKPDSEISMFTSYKGIPTSAGPAQATFQKIGETFTNVRLELESK